MQRNMKIKVDDSNRYSIINALEKLGHRRAENGLSFYETAGYFYTYEGLSQFTHGGSEDTFNEHENTEHFLVNGEFVTKDYWTQPGTAVIPQKTTAEWCKGCCPGTCGGCEKVHEVEQAPPLGLVSRKIWLQQRNVEILQAMQRYTETGKAFESGWLMELEDNNEEIRNAK